MGLNTVAKTVTFADAALLFFLGFELVKIETARAESGDECTFLIPEAEVESVEKDLQRGDHRPFLSAVVELKRRCFDVDRRGGKISYNPPLVRQPQATIVRGTEE